MFKKIGPGVLVAAAFVGPGNHNHVHASRSKFWVRFAMGSFGIGNSHYRIAGHGR